MTSSNMATTHVQNVGPNRRMYNYMRGTSENADDFHHTRLTIVLLTETNAHVKIRMLFNTRDKLFT